MEIYIDQTPVYYEEYGNGKPVLCLHGFPEDHISIKSSFEPVFNHMSGLRRIYVDLPGMGKSPVNPEVQNADKMLDVIKKFIEKCIGNENFLLAGQSYGGYLAMGLLLQMQERIDGVLLLCPCMVADRNKRILPDRQLISSDLKFIETQKNDGDFTEFMDYSVVVTENTWNRYRAEILPGLQNADTQFIKNYQSSGYGFSFEPEFKNISYNKPSCIITGRQDDCTGYMDALSLVNNFTRCTFSITDAAGHNMQIERPKLFNQLLADWILRLDLSEPIYDKNKLTDKSELINNIHLLHTTSLGAKRIINNLNLDTEDVVTWCKKRIANKNASMIRKGKNWYVSADGSEITINAHSYTIITAHKK